MEEQKDYMEKGVTRRQFISISGAMMALAALPSAWVWTKSNERNDYIRARAASLYLDDRTSKVRESHRNEAVMDFYREFAGQPLSELSEELLHTRYVDRSRLVG